MLCRHNNAAGAADSVGNLRRLHVSGGGGTTMEQSATTVYGRLITVIFLAADKGPSVSPVTRLLNVPPVP